MSFENVREIWSVRESSVMIEHHQCERLTKKSTRLIEQSHLAPNARVIQRSKSFLCECHYYICL